jgi:chromodomain-helicase-DNA-binding protein 4
MKAGELDRKFAHLDKENIAELHSILRPFFLRYVQVLIILRTTTDHACRRTKLQVLKDLPPMAQVIVPVTMCVVQKKLYRSILEKKPEVIRALLNNDKGITKQQRGGLNNLLMQLRKCLCHPFVYSEAIEQRSDDPEVTKRTLIDASSKLQLLEMMLPKLRERGHRVLIFSQFLMQLNILEDFLEYLGLPYERLDGNVSAMEKQRRIDAYNAPGSKLFAFLLSTRAGGVGINLATADTVIVMDPDFNPHQDIQAFSRAHRIGQKKKVLVFQLMTKGSAEEKITQIGRRKMALDKVLIESMNDSDDAGEDVASIMAHGAKALFDNDDRNDIRYDSTSVDNLLDRTTTESTENETGAENTTDSQFSFARVWANDKLSEDMNVAEEESVDPSLWDKIIADREAAAAAERAKMNEGYGRGNRRKTAKVTSYTTAGDEVDEHGNSPVKKRGRKQQPDSDDENDYNGPGNSAGEGEEDDEGADDIDPHELDSETRPTSRSKSIVSQHYPKGTNKLKFSQKRQGGRPALVRTGAQHVVGHVAPQQRPRDILIPAKAQWTFFGEHGNKQKVSINGLFANRSDTIQPSTELNGGAFRIPLSFPAWMMSERRNYINRYPHPANMYRFQSPPRLRLRTSNPLSALSRERRYHESLTESPRPPPPETLLLSNKEPNILPSFHLGPARDNAKTTNSLLTLIRAKVSKLASPPRLPKPSVELPLE